METYASLASADILCGRRPSPELKISTPVTPVMGNVYTNFGYCKHSRCRARSPCSAQTDGLDRNAAYYRIAA